MSLSDQQESALTSGGDCFEHYHTVDRVLDHNSLSQLQQLATTVNVTTNVTAKNGQDILLVDTTAASIDVTLPLAMRGMEFIIVKTAAANVLTIILSGTDLIYGASSVTAFVLGTSLHFKAITGGWILI